MDKIKFAEGLAGLLNKSEGERQFTLHMLKIFGQGGMPESQESCKLFEEVLIRGGLDGVREKTFLREPSDLEIPNIYRVLSSVEEAANDRKVRIAGYVAREGEQVTYKESNFLPFNLLYQDREITANEATFLLSSLIGI